MLEIKGLVSGYAGVRILHDVSLTVGATEMVALLGSNGVGKSTVMKTISGLLRCTEGSILFEGREIARATPEDIVQAGLVLVPEGRRLFNGMRVLDNLLIGNPDASEAALRDAAERAGCADFAYGRNWERDVGERGLQLSGGQKQRVAIARAVIKQPAVLLLDEATSALDNESERIVQAALDEIMAKQKRTTIVIAHRLSTIRNADKIVVLKQGRVEEQGTHDELLQNSEGLYFNLVLAQSS